MNHFAANALLKTLEEPPARTLVLLVTSQPSRLLPTLAQPLLAPAAASRRRARGRGRYLASVTGRGPWAEALAATGAGPFALLDADPAAIAQLRTETRSRRSRTSAAAIFSRRRWRSAGPAASLRCACACLESWVTERILESARSIRDVTHLPGAGLPPNICRLFEFSDAIRDMRKLSHTSTQQIHGGRSAAVALGAGRHERRPYTGEPAPTSRVC